jgi:hypothetical protein
MEIPSERWWRDQLVGNAFSWDGWRREIVRLLRTDFQTELHGLSFDDIDWFAWQPYYAQGRSPRQAIDRAFERDV